MGTRNELDQRHEAHPPLICNRSVLHARRVMPLLPSVTNMMIYELLRRDGWSATSSTRILSRSLSTLKCIDLRIPNSEETIAYVKEDDVMKMLEDFHRFHSLRKIRLDLSEQDYLADRLKYSITQFGLLSKCDDILVELPSAVVTKTCQIEDPRELKTMIHYLQQWKQLPIIQPVIIQRKQHCIEDVVQIASSHVTTYALELSFNQRSASNPSTNALTSFDLLPLMVKLKNLTLYICRNDSERHFLTVAQLPKTSSGVLDIVDIWDPTCKGDYPQLKGFMQRASDAGWHTRS